MSKNIGPVAKIDCQARQHTRKDVEVLEVALGHLKMCDKCGIPAVQCELAIAKTLDEELGEISERGK